MRWTMIKQMRFSDNRETASLVKPAIRNTSDSRNPAAAG